MMSGKVNVGQSYKVKVKQMKEGKLNNFEIVCRKCGAVATIEQRALEDIKDSNNYTFPVAVCHNCKVEESLFN
jgi:ribosomal protein L40E